VVVCGGSPAALGVITDLHAARAVITVFAVSVPTTVRDLADRSLITWHRRAWAESDLATAALVVPAALDRTENDHITAAARVAGRLCLAPVETDQVLAGATSGVGHVTLVGGGPGDPGLLTVAGLAAIQSADVIITDRLAPLAVLSQAPAGVEVIDVAKIPRGEFTSQERINELLVEHGLAGRRVVRLKGGDNFIFGRGGEEWQACAAAQVPVEVIPGVSSAVAAPALAGIPLTHRQLTQGFSVVSGHLSPRDPGSTLDWAALARTNTTLVILMGLATLGAITDELLRQDLAPDTPAATVADAGLASQRTVRGTVTDIAELTRRAGLKPPAITVIGAVVGFDPHRVSG
jgi:uroporphyrin-III C-methyltransferase